MALGTRQVLICHSRESGNPVLLAEQGQRLFPAQTRLYWIPAFAGMTGKCHFYKLVGC